MSSRCTEQDHRLKPDFEAPLPMKRAHILYAILVSAYFMSLLLRISASVVLPMEAVRLGMSATMTGLISSLFFCSYAAMQSVSGSLHDSFGPVRVVAAALLATATACLLMLPSRTPALLALWRFFSGFGVAAMYSAVLVFMAFAFPAALYCRYAGINYAVANLGAITSVAPLGFAIDTLGIPATFSLLSCICLFLAFLLFSNRTSDPTRMSAAMREPGGRNGIASLAAGLRNAFVRIMRDRKLRGILILWAISVAAFLALQGLWIVSWFAEAYDIPAVSARCSATSFGIGMMAGALLTVKVTAASGQLPRLIRLSCWGNTLCWAALVLAIGFRLPIAVAGGASLLLGVSCAIRDVFTMGGVNDLSDPREKGAIFGMMNMLVVGTAVAFQFGTGWIINRFPGALPGTYDATGYLVCFGGIVALLFASLSALRVLPRDRLR